MKTKFLISAGLLMLVTIQATAQKRCKTQSQSGDKGKWYPDPMRSIAHKSVHASYDASTTVLTVNFADKFSGGTVEVFCNGAKVTGITAGGGTTFSCILKDYGEGDYDIIVSRGNTVVYSRNVSIR
ncbi:MAG: hypothetical protein K5685_15590 [Bacteroidales bacterium]|nr:hypothetical protein [Bacteroidales bacterium]